MNFLSVGRVVYDINMIMTDFPKEGSETLTEKIINCCGGAASVVAYSLGKWNSGCFISGVIGYDEIGNFLKKNMEEHKVKTNFLETNYDIKTPSSYILLNTQNNSRTVISGVSNVHLKKYEYDVDIDCVIVDGYEYNASIYAFNKYSNGITILNAKTPDNKLLDFFRYAKYVIASSTVAEAMTGIRIDFDNPITITTVYKKIVEKYPKIKLLITVPDKGTIYSVGSEIKVLASMQTEVVDKTGARDIFVAMVGYGLTNGYDLEVCIRLATIAESMSKKTVGSTLSVPNFIDIEKYYESKFGTLSNNKEEVAKTEKIVVNGTVPSVGGSEVLTPTVETEVLNTTSESNDQFLSQVFKSYPVENNSNDTYPY